MASIELKKDESQNHEIVCALNRSKGMRTTSFRASPKLRRGAQMFWLRWRKFFLLFSEAGDLQQALGVEREQARISK